ncbi:MAG: hypothetical protein SFY80_07245 [Verrucomicrobiota bacterium]|nr:hypothetical protein [Verrucomicrobiota bacterium]
MGETPLTEGKTNIVLPFNTKVLPFNRKVLPFNTIVLPFNTKVLLSGHIDLGFVEENLIIQDLGLNYNNFEIHRLAKYGKIHS